jgi:hypothetical protein
MFVIVVLGSAVSYLILLYIQIVQGRSSLQTALAIIPCSLSIFAAAVLVLRLFDRLSSRHIAQIAFALVAGGLALLAVIVRNEWETVAVVLGLIVVGLGTGALVTLLFNVLAANSPKELAGDVGSLRGTTNNLAGGHRWRAADRHLEREYYDEPCRQPRHSKRSQIAGRSR